MILSQFAFIFCQVQFQEADFNPDIFSPPPFTRNISNPAWLVESGWMAITLKELGGKLGWQDDLSGWEGKKVVAGFGYLCSAAGSSK